jgi:hypothetical protein
MKTTQAATIITRIAKPDFGNGRYSEEMARIYTGCLDRFCLLPWQAEKIARQAGSDAGAALAATKVELKVGKMDKENMGRIEEASNLKKAFLTRPLQIVHALGWVGEAGKHGVSFGNTTWTLSSDLQEWVDSLYAPKEVNDSTIPVPVSV